MIITRIGGITGDHTVKAEVKRRITAEVCLLRIKMIFRINGAIDVDVIASLRGVIATSFKVGFIVFGAITFCGYKSANVYHTWE